MNKLLMEDIKRRQALTEEYASFSQSRGGLGKVLGGAAGLVVILAGTLLGGSLLTALLTIGATLLWLVGKEMIRARLYRSFGEVREVWSAQKRREHLLPTAIVGVICAGIAVFVVATDGASNPNMWAYLVFVLLTPFITWRFLRTPLEFIVGVFLLIACALHSAGGAYTLLPPTNASLIELSRVVPTWSPFIGAFVLIAVGWQEHRRFRRLTEQMRTED